MDIVHSKNLEFLLTRYNISCNHKLRLLIFLLRINLFKIFPIFNIVIEAYNKINIQEKNIQILSSYYILIIINFN